MTKAGGGFAPLAFATDSESLIEIFFFDVKYFLLTLSVSSKHKFGKDADAILDRSVVLHVSTTNALTAKKSPYRISI